MKSFLPRLVLLALSAVLLTPATGHAWQHAKRGGCNAGDPELPFAHKWRTLPVPYKIDTGSFATEGASTLAVTGTDAAFAEWTARTDSDFAVMNVGTTSATRLGNGDNEIFWLQTSWDATTGTDGNTLALTFTISDRRTGNSSDASGCPTVDRCDDANPCPAVEADIFMNADDPKMDVSAPWAWNQVAAYNSVPYVVLTHEVGHFLGLGHENSAPAINGSADNASIESLMDATPRPYAAASVVRADDAAGSAAIYPAGDALCVAEADCVLGDFCADISNNQCPVGSYCPPAGTSCPRAETCMSGACMEHGGDRGSPCIVGGLPGCNSELECVANGENIRGHCTGPCKTDADCTPNGHCRASDEGGEKQCVFGGDLPAGSECDSDDQCQSAACEDQKCAESCEVDCDCSDGYACTSGACVHGRSTCYYRDGRTDNRSLTATLCSVDAPPQPRTRPWAFYVAAIGLGVWFSRRATSRRPPPRR